MMRSMLGWERRFDGWKIKSVVVVGGFFLLEGKDCKEEEKKGPRSKMG